MTDDEKKRLKELIERMDLLEEGSIDELEEVISRLRARNETRAKRGTEILLSSRKAPAEMIDKRYFRRTMEDAAKAGEDEVKKILNQARKWRPLLNTASSANELIAFPWADGTPGENFAALAKLIRFTATPFIKGLGGGNCEPEWQEVVARSELVQRARQALTDAKSAQTLADARVAAAVTALTTAQNNYDSATELTDSETYSFMWVDPWHGIFVQLATLYESTFLEFLRRAQREHENALQDARIAAMLVALRETQLQEAIDAHLAAMMAYMDCVLRNAPL